MKSLAFSINLAWKYVFRESVSHSAEFCMKTKTKFAKSALLELNSVSQFQKQLWCYAQYFCSLASIER
jgi:hypothetical protein